MKKKIFLTLVMAVAFALTLVLMVSAATHAGKEIDINETVTLSGEYVDANGNAITTVNLFDSEGNALIWYKNGSTLESIRADDERVMYSAGNYTFNVGNSEVGVRTAYEVTSMWIQLDESTKISQGNIVVLNLMDDDVKINDGGNQKQIVNCVKGIAWANKVIEYAFLRLDTVAIQAQAFCGCPKLKYINLEDLTELRQIGGGQTFSQDHGKTVLFEDEILDLTKTKLATINGNGTFTSVPFVGIKLPATTSFGAAWMFQHSGIASITIPTTVKKINDNMFKGCYNLTTIILSNTTTEIANDVFKKENNREPILEKIFFVGTKAELEALVANTNTSNNAPFLAVAENMISYADYLALADKSGKYAVYDYNYCEAYNEGIHSVTGENPCVGTCSVCQMAVVNHSASADVTVSYVYTSFAQNGQKITSCANDDCTYEVVEALDPLFTCNGFSASQTGTNGIVLGFKVNQEAIVAYTEATGNTIKYGVFAGSQASLGNNDLSDENLSEKVIKAEIAKTEFAVFEIKILGFTTDEQKDAKLAIGGYVEVTDGEDVTTYSYMQLGTPADGEIYSYDTFNNIIASLN